MSHKHEKLLNALFQERPAGNIHWREIEALLHHLGASVESLSGARIRVKLNGVEGVLHRPHHGNQLDRSGIQHVREYLAQARVTPALYEASRHVEPEGRKRST